MEDWIHNKEELNQKDGEESSNVEKEEEKKLTSEEEIETLKDKNSKIKLT